MNLVATIFFFSLWIAVILGQTGYLSPGQFLNVAGTIMPFLSLALHWDDRPEIDLKLEF
ncbi:hypothetical protein BDW59DRAFT_140867 [Aspergillus cavernicola]|uniref:Uncharacterized protein n=1 Tax=Aspergillus cavernicola TaxID=176166 RepID=A0ABR4ISS1_9EURO